MTVRLRVSPKSSWAGFLGFFDLLGILEDMGVIRVMSPRSWGGREVVRRSSEKNPKNCDVNSG